MFPSNSPDQFIIIMVIFKVKLKKEFKRCFMLREMQFTYSIVKEAKAGSFVVRELPFLYFMVREGKVGCFVVMEW